MKSKSKLDEVLDGAETNFIKKMSYTDYLNLDQVLGAQKPISNTHDEMLFYPTSNY